MDPTTQSVLIGLMTNYVTSFTAPQITTFFRKVFELRPALEQRLKYAKKPTDFQEIFREATGIIEAAAGSGSIEIDQSILEALRGIRFDHQNGTIVIQGSVLKSGVLETGGSGNGTTAISGSRLKSQGTEMLVGSGATIKITGNAKIIQT